MVQHLNAILLCIAAFFLPLGEGITLIALAVSVALTVVSQCRWLPDIAALQRTWSEMPWPLKMMATGFLGLLFIGTVAAILSGYTPRASHANKMIMASVVVVGWSIAHAATVRTRQTILVAFLAGLTAACLLGLCQYWFGTFPGESVLIALHGERHRPQLYSDHATLRAATGTLLNRIKMANVLIAGCGAWLALLYRYFHVRWLRWLSALGIGLTAYTLYATHVRAALGAMAIAVLVWWCCARWQWVRRRIGMVMMAMIVVSFSVAVVGGATAPWNTTHEDPPPEHIAIRRWIWKHALHITQQHPILGTGIGTYHKAAVDERPPTSPDRVDPHLLDAHNQHLMALAEGGVMGLLCWWLFCAGLCGALTMAWRADAIAPHSAFLRDVATLWLTALIVMGTVHNTFFHAQSALLWWLATAWCMGFAWHARHHKMARTPMVGNT